MIIAGGDLDFASHIGEFVRILNKIDEDLFKSTLVTNKPLWELLIENSQLRADQLVLVGQHLELVDRPECDADILVHCFLFKHLGNEVKGFLWVKDVLLEPEHAFVNHIYI